MVMLLASNLDNIPDCPEMLNYGPQKVMSVTALHHPGPLPVVFGRTDLQDWLGYNDAARITDHRMRVVPPCFVRVAQQAADPSPPRVVG
jgi:hypothetical protein